MAGIQAKVRANVPAFLPLGATEQHGPHLPHSINVVLSTGVCEGVANEMEPVDPETYDDGTDEAHLHAMFPKLLNRIPSLMPTLTQPNYGGAFVAGYLGVYFIIEDGDPIVGEDEVGGHYSCFGGSGHGFKIGPAIGESLAATIGGQASSIDISSLSVSRFSEGRTFSSVWGAGIHA